MFALFLEPAHRVLLSCFSGTFTTGDLARCDRAVMLALGRTGPVRGIIDLSNVEKVEIPPERIRERARQPPMAAGQARILVAQSPAALQFARLYATAYGEFGGVGLHVVGTREDACRVLGLVDPRFEPLELP